MPASALASGKSSTSNSTSIKLELERLSMKILFLHGFYASGQCVPAMALREAFEGRSEVITPDLPMHPKEAVQFNHFDPNYRDRIWGLFGEQDTLAHFEPMFLEHYHRSFHFPGGHTPTAEEVRDWYVPLAKKMLELKIEKK